MPLLWESNEIYFVAGVSLFVTLGVFASLAYFLYQRAAANGRRASEEQAALEKVLLRKEAVPTTSSSPPTNKPLIVSPSFSSPNKVPARHLRSGSYSPTHYLSPYHNRQPRRNSSPTSHLAPNSPYKLQLHHPQLQLEEEPNQNVNFSVEEEVNPGATAAAASNSKTISSGSSSPSEKSKVLENAIKTGNNSNVGMKSTCSLPQIQSRKVVKQPQYYGTIPPRRTLRSSGGRAGRGHSDAMALNKNKLVMKGDYVQLPGEEFFDEESCTKKDLPKSQRIVQNKNEKGKKDEEGNNLESDLKEKILLQKQFEQKSKAATNKNISGESYKMDNSKHCDVQEDIPFYISTQ